jgi:hypothetical protein
MSLNRYVCSANFKTATIVIFAITWLSCFVSNSIAQRPSSSRDSLAVDEVTLTGGKKMYGIVMQQDPNAGLTMMVERAWFEKTYPKLYATHLESELKSDIELKTKHLFRLEAWWKSRVDDADLVTFIDKEMERIEKERDARKVKGSADLKPFTVLVYPAAEIQNVHIQSPERHRIAGLGWKHNVDRVTTRSITAIKRDLENLKVDTNTETFDLSSQLPSTRDQSEFEWNSRVALVEFKLRTQLEFQGMGSNLIRIRPDKPADQQVDAGTLMKLLLGSGLAGGGQVDDLLKELGLPGTNNTETQWWKNAARIAEAENVSGFLVTRVIQNAASPIASVEHSFFAQVKPGQWKQVARLSASANRNDVEQANVDRIKDDPQVKKALSISKGLGLDSANAIDQAIRQGAATETALIESRNRFYEFLNRFTERTDRPMLSFKQ